MGKYQIWSDGGGLSHTPGGCGAVIIDDSNNIEEYFWGYKISTNNRMELTAVINAITMLPPLQSHEITVYSDSQYVTRGFNEWLMGWSRKGFKDVKNVDLWTRMIEVTAQHDMTFTWIRGHDGNQYNEAADALATKGKNMPIDEQLEDKGYPGKLT